MFAFGTAQATTVPFMAIYFSRAFGTVLAGGLLLGSVIASIISGAAGGYLADIYGRKRVMVASEIFFLLSYLVMCAANSPWIHSPWSTFVAYLLVTICWGVYGPADEAMMLDVTDAKSRPLMYSITYWGHNLTLAVGSSIGALFFDSSRFLLFGIMALVVLGSLLTTIFAIKETHRPNLEHLASRQEVHWIRDFYHNYRNVIRDLPFVRYLIASALLMSVEFQLTNYISVRLAKAVVRHVWFQIQHFSVVIDGIKLVGWLQTENTLIVVVFAALASALARKCSTRTVILLACVLMVVGYSVLDVAQSPWLLFVLMAVATFGEIFGVATRQSFLGDLALPTARSSYLALNGMTFNVSRALASLGVMMTSIATSWEMAGISGGIGIVAIGLFWSIITPAAQRKEQINLDFSIMPKEIGQFGEGIEQ